MGVRYEPFLRRLQPGSRSLDAGCGYGRDRLTFNGCGELMELARTETGLSIE
jgi:hypothetical protein